MKNQFSEVYHKLPTVKLLEIIENPDDYQELAIETAKFELSTRNDIVASENEWQKQKNALHEKSVEAKKKIIAKQDKVKELSDKADTLDDKTLDKSIPVICILLFVIFIAKTIQNFDFIISSITFLENADLFTYRFLLEYIYLPVAIIYTWKMSKTGWIMLIVFFIYNIFKYLVDLYQCYELFGTDTIWSLIAAFSVIFPYLILYSGLLYYLLRQEVRELFETSPAEEHEHTA